MKFYGNFDDSGNFHNYTNSGKSSFGSSSFEGVITAFTEDLIGHKRHVSLNMLRLLNNCVSDLSLWCGQKAFAFNEIWKEAYFLIDASFLKCCIRFGMFVQGLRVTELTRYILQTFNQKWLQTAKLQVNTIQATATKTSPYLKSGIITLLHSLGKILLADFLTGTNPSV